MTDDPILRERLRDTENISQLISTNYGPTSSDNTFFRILRYDYRMESIFLDYMVLKLIVIAIVFFIAGFMGWLGD